jgi:hypothetical protein
MAPNCRQRRRLETILRVNPYDATPPRGGALPYAHRKSPAIAGAPRNAQPGLAKLIDAEAPSKVDNR